MDETFTKARAYLAQNYSDPELSLTDLCQYLGFSCSYFSTLFKQKTGLNYSRYITSLRLEQAAKLLTDTDDIRWAIPPLIISAGHLRNFTVFHLPATEKKKEFLPPDLPDGRNFF